MVKTLEERSAILESAALHRELHILPSLPIRVERAIGGTQERRAIAVDAAQPHVGGDACLAVVRAASPREDCPQRGANRLLPRVGRRVIVAGHDIMCSA